MARTFEQIDSELTIWLAQQPLFFVATAPLAAGGLINCSPKGLDSFRVLAPTRVAYLDLHGSGIETLAHLKENGRIVFLFCAFSGPPRIVRLHGHGRAHELGSQPFEALRSQFADLPGARSIIEVELHRISDSCGYGVPRMELLEQRTALCESAQRKGSEGLARSRERNRVSLEGLPGMTS